MSPVSSYEQFVIDNRISIIKGKGDLPFIRVENKNANALVSIYGAQVLSYQPQSHDDLLFVSDAAYFEQGKAIKGGIPICWPWFGRDAENPEKQMHGFARNLLWQLDDTISNDEYSQIVLSLVDTEETRQLWPHDFKLELTITIGKTLQLSLNTENTGTDVFKITQALHAYFAVADINQTQVSGLNGIEYIDTVNGVNKTIIQEGNVVIKQEVDRIYTDVSTDLSVIDSKANREVEIDSTGSKTAIIWNPWIEISKNSGDLTEDAYQQFVCVETANAADDFIQIQPNESYTIGVEYLIV